MKILKIQDITPFRGKEPNDMDLLNCLVEYNDGVTGNSYMYRAKYDKLIFQADLIKKYNITEYELNVFTDLIRDEIDTEHFYNET